MLPQYQQELNLQFDEDSPLTDEQYQHQQIKKEQLQQLNYQSTLEKAKYGLYI